MMGMMMTGSCKNEDHDGSHGQYGGSRFDYVK